MVNIGLAHTVVGYLYNRSNNWIQAHLLHIIECWEWRVFTLVLSIERLILCMILVFNRNCFYTIGLVYGNVNGECSVMLELISGQTYLPVIDFQCDWFDIFFLSIFGHRPKSFTFKTTNTLYWISHQWWLNQQHYIFHLFGCNQKRSDLLSSSYGHYQYFKFILLKKLLELL